MMTTTTTYRWLHWALFTAARPKKGLIKMGTETSSPFWASPQFTSTSPRNAIVCRSNLVWWQITHRRNTETLSWGFCVTVEAIQHKTEITDTRRNCSTAWQHAQELFDFQLITFSGLLSRIRQKLFSLTGKFQVFPNHVGTLLSSLRAKLSEWKHLSAADFTVPWVRSVWFWKHENITSWFQQNKFTCFCFSLAAHVEGSEWQSCRKISLSQSLQHN